MKTTTKRTAKLITTTTKMWFIVILISLSFISCGGDDAPVAPPKSTEATLSALSFSTTQNNTLYQNVTAVVDESAKTITATVTVIVPAASINKKLELIPELNISSNATVSPANNTAITVGGSTSPVTYTVTAEDGTTTQAYTLTTAVKYINEVATQLVAIEDALALYAIKNANPSAAGVVANWNLNDASMAAIETSLTSNGVTINSNDRIEELDIRESNLSVLPTEIGNLTEITKLSVYKNNIEVLPDEIGNLTNLTLLSLTDNSLQDLPATLTNITNLERLYLGDNNFNGTIPNVVFQLTNLQRFGFSSNSLEELPAEIGNLTNLRALFLNNNDLRALPAEIGSLTNLYELELDYNFLRVSGLPDEMADLSNLTWLRLFHNPHLNATTSASLSSTLCTFFNNLNYVGSDLDLTAC